MRSNQEALVMKKKNINRKHNKGSSNPLLFPDLRSHITAVFFLALFSGILLFIGNHGYAQIQYSKPYSQKTDGKAPADCNKIFITPQRETIQKDGRRLVRTYPARIDALICFEPMQDRFLLDALYSLDSIYNMVFKNNTDRFYKITIVGYDDGDPISEESSKLARQRAVSVFNYFSSREETEYIVKTTASSYFNSCKGNVDCFIRYKVPFDFKWINLFKKSEQERMFNNVSLKSKCHIIVEEDSEACLGEFFDYYVPGRDTTLFGEIAKIKFHKGSIDKTLHTKDTLKYHCTITFKECLSFENLTSNYHMVPHRKQRIINAGYFVINCPQKPDFKECVNPKNYPDSIFITVPLEEHQTKGNLKFYAKQLNNKGELEYKMIPTKRERDKETKTTFLVGTLNAFQCDTVYLGRRVPEDEMDDYFYPSREGEPGAFYLEDVWIKPYRLNKRGEMEMKKKMIPLLRYSRTGAPKED